MEHKLPLAVLGLVVIVGAIALTYYATQGSGVFSRQLAQLLPPPPPNVQYTLSLSPGWNLASSPVAGNTRVVQNGCGSVTVWHYDTSMRRYVPGSGFESMAAGAGYWVNMPAACGVTLQGDTALADLAGTPLSAGWNQVGSPFTAVKWDTNAQGTCAGKVTSGPWRYNSDTRAYEQATQLEPGNGYWVKVSEACALGSAGPTQPPQQFVGGTVTPTPTPTPPAKATPTPTPSPTSTPTPTPTPSPGGVITVTSACQTFDAPGTYQLTGDLTEACTGVTFTSGASGSVDSRSVLDCHGFTIRGGLALKSVDYFTVQNCVLENGGISAGGIAYSGGYARYSQGITLSGNTLSRGGISIYYTQGPLVDGNTLNGGGIDLSWVSGGRVYKSTIHDNEGNGISLTNAQHVLLKENKIYNNKWSGIYLYDSYSNQLQGNTVEHNAQAPGAAGIYVGGSNVGQSSTYSSFDNGFYLNRVCDNGYSSDFLIADGPQSIGSGSPPGYGGNTCGTARCRQNGVWNVCVPNQAGSGNCANAC